MKSASLIIAHGSREVGSNRAFLDIVARLKKTLPREEREWIFGAFLELVHPTIPEGIEQCVKLGANEIFIQPLLLFPGRHVKKHIPEFIESARKKYPGVKFRYGQSLSKGSALLFLLREKIKIA